MFFFTIISDYMTWHYTTALLSFIRLFKNFSWYLSALFSIPQLSRTLLAPYKRMVEPRGSLLDLEGLVGYVLVNILSRLIGFVLRLVIIVSGVVSLLCFCILSVVTYAIWLIAPILIIVLCTCGIWLLL